ncbi:g10841 [Coccomyxa elongata]
MSVDAAQLTDRIEEALRLSEKASDDPDIAQALTDLLKTLQSFQVTTQLLLETQAGKKIRKLAKHSNAAISQAAAATVSSWKEAVTKETVASTSAGAAANGSAGVFSQGSQSSSQPSQPSQQAGSAAAAENGQPPPAKRQKSISAPNGAAAAQPSASQAVIVPKTGDSVRDKTRQLFAEALLLAREDAPDRDVGAAASEAESAMYRQNGGVNARYKAKYRSLIFNLKDANNPDLRRRVLSGEITGDVLVNLSAEEMASDARKSENEQIRKTALFEAERGQHMKKATTDQFQCGKCKQRKCQYYQMQTRSADEPMTTFVTCTVCGNRWKFC